MGVIYNYIAMHATNEIIDLTTEIEEMLPKSYLEEVASRGKKQAYWLGTTEELFQTWEHFESNEYILYGPADNKEGSMEDYLYCGPIDSLYRNPDTHAISVHYMNEDGSVVGYKILEGQTKYWSIRKVEKPEKKSTVWTGTVEELHKLCGGSYDNPLAITGLGCTDDPKDALAELYGPYNYIEETRIDAVDQSKYLGPLAYVLLSDTDHYTINYWENNKIYTKGDDATSGRIWKLVLIKKDEKLSSNGII